MDKTKIKNIIVLILLMLNLCLLLVVSTKTSNSKDLDQQKTQALYKVLDNYGINLGKDVDLDIKAPQALVIERDLKQEEKDIAKLIGECSSVDLGGNIIYYSGENGLARVRGGGEIEISLNNGVINVGKKQEDSIKKFLQLLGYEFDEIKEKNGGDSSNSLSASFYYGDYKIFNSNMVFSFSNYSLGIITGTKPHSCLKPIKSQEECIDTITVLMSFLSHVDKNGQICSSITGLEVGYVLESTGSDTSNFKPIYKITTDVGEFNFDALTGKIMESL